MRRVGVPTLVTLFVLVPGLAGAAMHHRDGGGDSAMHRDASVQVGHPQAGQRLFREKGCVVCHAIKGVGGQVGPDLGRLQHTHNVYQMASIMWNHAVAMRAVMAERGVARPTFKGDEMAHLLAYLHSLEVVGDPARGRRVFEQKGCARCHAIGGEGGKVGPDLARTAHPHPPLELAGAMWNHSPTMTAVMEAMRIPRPVFEGNEMADLLAYLAEAQRRSARDRAPGHDPGGH